MNKKEGIKLCESELKVMELLWEEGELRAGEIVPILSARVGWNRNTTYTIIKKCVEKGAIRRIEPKFVCQPLVTKEQTQVYEIMHWQSGCLMGVWKNCGRLWRRWWDNANQRTIKTLSVERPSYWWCRFTLFLCAEIWFVWHDLMFFLRGVSRLTIVSKYIDFAL